MYGDHVNLLKEMYFYKIKNFTAKFQKKLDKLSKICYNIYVANNKLKTKEKYE
jgi:hypothetical protein